MRIGLLTQHHMDQVGGAEEALDQLARRWQSAGRDVVLFWPPSRKSRRQCQRDPGYPQVKMPRPLSTRRWLSRYTKILTRQHRRRPFDIVMACGAYWAGHVARMFSRQSGVPFVICSQGGDVMQSSSFLTKDVTRRRLSEVIREAHGVACISGYIEQRLKALGPPRGVCRFLPNGWPDEWMESAALPSLVGGRYVFSMGRAVKLKGFQTLIDAFALVRARHPQVSLVVAGEGDYLPQLVEQAHQLALHPRRALPSPDDGAGVFFPGFVAGDAKRALVQNATLGVSPSIRQEPMSLVLFEMLCCGVPVVGSQVGGTPDVVRPGVNGELFPAEDSRQLAACLGRLLGDEHHRQNLARRAFASVEDYCWSKIADGYLSLFDDVLSQAAA